MQIFKVKSLTEWEVMLPGEVIQMEAANSRRVVYLDLMASGRVYVYVASDPEMTGRVLVAMSEGRFAVEYAAPGHSYVQFEAADDVEIYLQTHARPHMVAKNIAADPFTTIAPQNRRNTEFDRMMMVMKYNERRRDEQHTRELQRLREELTQRAPEPEGEARPARQPAAADPEEPVVE